MVLAVEGDDRVVKKDDGCLGYKTYHVTCLFNIITTS